MKYKRILLKISGESLMGDREFGHDHETIQHICSQIKDLKDLGDTEIALVVGGGNIYRGISAAAIGMERASADYMGMLATVINALALQNALEKMDVDTRVLSAIPMTTICESYIRRRAVRHMEKGRVIIFASGTGNPFFTTDTAAALRAVEMGCDAIFKATQVDGVYDSDPKKNPNAKRYETLSYRKVLNNDLKVMDAAAVTLARENKIPILVFAIKGDDSLKEIANSQGKFTVINEGG